MKKFLELIGNAGFMFYAVPVAVVSGIWHLCKGDLVEVSAKVAKRNEEILEELKEMEDRGCEDGLPCITVIERV